MLTGGGGGGGGKESQPSTSSYIEYSQPCRQFEFREILLATNNFDESLRAVDTSLDETLATWAQGRIKEGNLKHIVDINIKDQISPKCLKEFVRIAERCLHNNPKQRPTMAEVVVSLNFVLTLQHKTNTTSRTIFGRMLHMFPFPPKRENSAKVDSNLLKNTKGNSANDIDTAGDDNKDFTIPIPSLGVSMFFDSKWQAELARLEGLHTLKGHVESVMKFKGLDIETMQQYYTI
ncbi:unnamed protein product [Lactuca virosa]|uniref:Serine-threonine/tyrosine-protein kinase catalytic domain-containing protein n=1 Tax=Lactuca virosa TaxID=75947 RepID=A0AAU9P372_9ASTR|nr:unnamed protein product [Lactuca virosa]